MSDLSYLHFVAGAVVTPIAAEVLYRSRSVRDYTKAVAYPAFGILTAGLLKEINDAYHFIESVGGMPQGSDLLLDVSGVALGATIGFVGNKLRRNNY